MAHCKGRAQPPARPVVSRPVHSPRLSTLVLWVLYAASAAVVATVARFLRRPVPLPEIFLFVALPVAFLWPGFRSDRTPIPVEDVRTSTPWLSLPPPFGIPEPRRNPYLDDVAFQIAPWQKAVREAWRSGELPWLDRWNGCGTPLAGNAQSAAFSPFTIVGLALPLARAFTLAAALKLLLAGVGMALWLAELGASRAASVFGGTVFAFSYLMAVWLPWPITAVVCLWPWALFLVERLDDPERRGATVTILAAVFASWALAGHPESAALGGGFVAVWIALRAARRSWKRPGAVIGGTAAAALAALGLTASLLVPEIHAIRASHRRASVEELRALHLGSWSPHAPEWKPALVTPVFPRAFGDGIEAPMFPSVAYAFPEISSAYVGAAGWTLVLLTLRPGRRRAPPVFAAIFIAAFAAVEAAWTWPVVEAVSRVPAIGMVLPMRFHAWVTLCATVLAAFELDRLRADVRERPTRALALTAGAAIFGTAAVALFFRLRRTYAAIGGISAERKDLALLLVVLAVIGAAGVAAAKARRPELLLAPVLTVAALVELMAGTIPLDRLGRSGQVFPPTPLVEFLRTRPGSFRVVGRGYALFPNANVFAGVEDVRTHDPMERNDYVAFLDATCGYPPDEYFKTVRDPDARVFDFLNVRYAVAAPGKAAPGARWKRSYAGTDGVVYENTEASPRVFAPAVIRRLPGGNPDEIENAFDAFGQPAKTLLSGLDWRREAVVLFAGPAPAASAATRIFDIAETTNRITFSAVVPGSAPAALVASEVQDGGWRAHDESGPLETGRANGPFLAIEARPGAHRIVLSYAPPGIRLGSAISVATAALIAGAAVFRRRRDSRRIR